MAFDKSKYDQAYNKANMITKRVPFNRQIPEDVKILEYAEHQDENFTQYIKALIRQDMNRNHDENTNA